MQDLLTPLENEKKKRKNKKQNLQNHSKTPTVQLTASVKTRGSGINGPVWIYLLLNTLPYKVLLHIPTSCHTEIIHCRSGHARASAGEENPFAWTMAMAQPGLSLSGWLMVFCLDVRAIFCCCPHFFCRFFLLGSIVLLSFSGCCRQAAVVLNSTFFERKHVYWFRNHK